MTDCCQFVSALAERGWTHAGGVPCSTFSGPIAHLTTEGRYRPAANEGLALSDAAGAWLGGRRQAVFLQNSGFGNLLNPLTSLCQPYEIPVLAFMSMRGWPDPSRDEPQHEVMGTTVESLLSTIGISTLMLNDDEVDSTLDRAVDMVDAGRPVFVLVPFRSIGKHPGASEAAKSERASFPDTAEVARTIAASCSSECAIFSTTGFASRFLFAAGDRARNFYMQGSMGHASSLALGYAATHPERTVVVLDGDGAALMHMGIFSTVGASRPANLVHVIVDNGSYESTGSQPSTAPTTDFVAIGQACGYASARAVGTVDDLRQSLADAFGSEGPALIVVRAIEVDAAVPNRAGAQIELPEVAARLRTH